MNSPAPSVLAPRHLWRATWLIVLVWTLAVAASVVWNVHLLRDAMFEAAVTDVRNDFNNALLCLTNPANMTRQVHELGAQADGMLGHITSLKPSRPENAPDAWEAAALRAFEQGQTEVISREPFHGQRQLRFMKPLVTEAACLKCHAVQGYHEGDIRGGISIAVPLDPYLALTQSRIRRIAGVHAGLWALGVLGIVLDARQMRQRLNQKLRAEEALRRSETKFRTLYESTRDAVMLSTENGFSDCNQAALAMFGYATREEFCSKHPADVSPPVQPDGTDSLTLANQRIATAMEKGSHQFEWVHKRADTGETFPAEVLLSALELDGKPVLLGSVRDITRRRRSEESLRLQSAALEAAANAIVITDHHGTIESVNSAFTALTGYTAQEVVGQNPRILKGGNHDEAFYRNLWQTISSGQVWSGELTNRRKDGSLYAEEMTITPLRDADGVIARYIAIKQDISGRKRAEEALHRSETKFRTLYDSTSDAVMLLDEKGFFDCNPATLAMFGCGTREEFCSKHPADVSPPVQPDGTDSLMLANQRIATAMEKGSHQFEWVHKRADTGETFPAEVLLSAMELDGKPVLQAVVRDITRRKELEAQMERLHTEHAAVLNSLGEGVHWIDVDGRIKYENPASAKMLGYEVSELIGKPAHATMHHTRADGAAYPQSECPIYATLRDGVVRRVTDEVFWRKDGAGFAVEYVCTPVYDQNGRSGGSVVIFTDITERRRMEEALREKEYLLSESQRLSHIGSWFLLMPGPMHWSEELYRLYGVSPDTFTPTTESFLGLIHPDDRSAMQAWIGACAAGEKPGGLEFRINLPDGTSRFILGCGQAVFNAGNRLTHMAGTGQDITERKVAETRLAALQKQLLDASRQAGMAEIATNVLHNVGNVLNSVNISTSLIVESVKNSRTSSLARVVVLLREHAQDLGEFITHDSRGKHLPAHLAQLSEHLLAEQETNARELDSLRRNVDHIKEIVAMQQNYATFGGVKEMVNVANLVEDSLRMNAGPMSRHEVEVIREFETVPPLNVEKHKILQILVNLLRNAKYACDDSERPDKRLKVRVANGDGRVKISVIDNGVGIPPENLTRIFNHGFTTRKDGHGFGLHSSALAAKEMGGSLTVHSDGVGRGAAFTLELPCPARENSHE
jgi:PAS domain S-box-containing protein